MSFILALRWHKHSWARLLWNAAGEKAEFRFGRLLRGRKLGPHSARHEMRILLGIIILLFSFQAISKPLAYGENFKETVLLAGFTSALEIFASEINL